MMIKSELEFFYFEIEQAPLGGVHKLRLQDLAFFEHLSSSVYIFYGVYVYKNSIFLTTYPPPLVNIVCEQPLKLYIYC